MGIFVFFVVVFVFEIHTNPDINRSAVACVRVRDQTSFSIFIAER